MAEAAPSIAWPAMTVGRLGKNTMSRQPTATSRPEPATSRRLTFSESTSNPAGIWKIAAATEEAAIAMPMFPGAQC